MSDRVTDIGIDIDGVLYPFGTAFKNWWQVETDSLDLEEPTEWNFYRQWGMTDEEFQMNIVRASWDGVFSGLPPIEGVREGWQMLSEMDVRLHVITHRPPAAWAQTATWLEQNFLVPHSLSFMYDKSVISYLAQRRSAMIEDRPDFIVELDAAGVVPFIMDQPWNRSPLPGHRVSNMVEFAEQVKPLVEG